MIAWARFFLLIAAASLWYSSAFAQIGGPVAGAGAVGTANITGGTINNATIGATTPSTGAFTTITSTQFSPGSGAKILVRGNGTNATQIAGTQTTVPTCSTNCGTSPSVAGSDTAGIVTMGASGVPASGWVVTFNGTWAAAPSCIVQSALATMVVGKMPIAVVTTTTTITVTTNGTAPSTSDKYAYHCIGVS